MNPLPPPPPVKKKGLGCVGVGCLILAFLAVLFLGGTAVSVYFVYSALEGLTSEHGEVVGAEDQGQAVYQAACDKITAFQNGTNPETPLTLNSDEINTLIAESPGLANLKNHVYVIIKGDLATIQMSLPISGLPAHLYEGRYFNATVSGNVEIVDGKIGVRPVMFDILNKSYSGHSLDSVQTLDWDSMLHGNPQINSWLAQVKSLKIENDQLEITHN